MVKADPDLIDKVRELGAFDISACYSCGNCTAICPLSKEGQEFPRKIIRYAVLGLREKILASVEPWLCYYCGDCTETCPRDADPGGFMMALRRYLTTEYDFTGFSKALYFSKKIELLSIIILAAITGLVVYLLKGPIVPTHADLWVFAPRHIVAWANVIVFAVLSVILIINIYRMYKMSVGSIHFNKIPVSKYITEFIKVIPLHFFTQKRRVECGEEKRYYIIHLLLFYGYAAIFIHHTIRHMLLPLIAPSIHPSELASRIVGISAFCALILGSSIAIYGRITKSEIYWRYSHPTDWMFIILLWLTSITGLLTDIFVICNYPLPTYITFSVHLMFVVPLLCLEVPFAKWSHLAYRPFALYFQRLKEIALSQAK